MKTKKLLMAVFSLFILAACSEQETDSVEITNSFAIAKKDWERKALSSTFFENQSQISHYSFSKKDIQSVLSTPNLSSVRFIVGLQNDQIIINLVGVNTLNEEISSVSSSTNFHQKTYDASIESLQNNSFQYSRARLDAPIIGQHLLSYNATFSYITNWNKALNTQNIEEMITDDGIRFRYYSLEKEVLTDMISNTTVESIGLFLGLNSENKMTTVFLKKNKENLMILNTNQRNNGGDALDFTRPCPSACDPPSHCICENGTTNWGCCPKENN